MTNKLTEKLMDNWIVRLPDGQIDVNTLLFNGGTNRQMINGEITKLINIIWTSIYVNLTDEMME